jgi:tetratricopeptide (TPR) repeat protein
MWWAKAWFVAAGSVVIACTPLPTPGRAVAPSRVRVPAPAPAAAAPWPDVARDARSEKSSVHDAAVVVAVERHASLPDLPGVRVSGEDWVRFFPNVVGMPPDRVTALFDASATRAAISSAVRAAATRVAPGGRLWIIAIGYAAVSEAEIASAADRADVQVVSVGDVVPDAAELVRRTPAPIAPRAFAPITFSIVPPTPLPGAARPALSYLLMGALRGWGDRDGDGRVTASEAAAYLDITLRLVSRRGSSRPTVKMGTELACSELTTLSVAREPAPNVMEIAPRVPSGPSPSPERLASALEAVRAADAQLAIARASGPLKDTPTLREWRLIGEGDERRIEVVVMPPEVEATRRVRLEQAKRLGGPTVREAAPLLVEAGRLSLAYGRVEEGKEVLAQVVEGRCGADAAGLEAWQSLWAVTQAVWTPSGKKDATLLASIDCTYDEVSASALDRLFVPVHLWDHPNKRARRVYDRAEEEEGGAFTRCTWSAAAEKYAQSWWSDPEPVVQVEAALNAAYAFDKLGRSDDAAALYRSFVRKHGGSRAGEAERPARDRRVYAVAACADYLALAKEEPRHLPGYFDVCRNVSCAARDHVTCAQATRGPVVVRLGISTPEAERARQLTLAAHDREELAGWEPTEAARATRLREAVERYAAAEAAWAAIVDSGDATSGSDEAARRLAEVAVRRLVVALGVGAEVTEESIERARQLARRARDLSYDERRVEPARLLVELADGLLAREHRAFAASQGKHGVAPRVEVRLEGEGEHRRFMMDELPLAVATAISARDEYLDSVPATFDPDQLRYRMAHESGRWEFLYGHFAEARRRLQLPYVMECGVSPVAHEAWLLLLSMANLEGNVAQASSLATDVAICACDVETRIRSDRMRKPVRGIFVLEGRRQLQASEALPEGPERRRLRREAAAIFRQFVDEAPARDEAPEAARLAAELYLELDETARALEMYRRFVENYRGEARVSVAELEKAYAALARLHARLGDYRAQALVLVEESEQKRLPAKARAAAARKARELRMDRDGRHRGAAPNAGG